MLSSLLGFDYSPATNLSQSTGRVSWKYLLPKPRFRSALCLGLPSLSKLITLCSNTEVIYVLGHPTTQPHPSLQNALREGRLIFCGAADQLPPSGVDLVFAQDLSLISADFLNSLRLSLAPDAVLYAQHLRRRDPEFILRLRLLGFLERRDYWSPPLRPDGELLFPAHPRHLQYVLTHVLTAASPINKMLGSCARGLLHTGLLTSLPASRSVFFYRTPVTFIPALQEAIRSAGLDPASTSIGISSRGTYDSNKTVAFLFAGADAQPTVVVKFSRDARFNSRIAHEHRILEVLQLASCVPSETLPVPRGYGIHDGLAVETMDAVQGDRFENVSSLQGDCPHVQALVGWLITLGRNSRTTRNGSDIAAVLRQLLATFVRICRPEADEVDFLSAQIAHIAEAPSVPLVFQHGDLGVWNIMVSDGHPVIMDWENGEPEGMPLWDLFYFLRACANRAARRKGKRDPVRNFRTAFGQPSVFRSSLKRHISLYASAVGIDPSLWEPLWFTCWMHRALKEASMLAPSEQRSGIYLPLLRDCMTYQDDYRAAISAVNVESSRC